ncbi:MAG: hypothetical protein JSR17_09085 [Proteobacteria bacterium]|nr:hypothetical protein [Pseudomonadota bacterium]
MRNLTFQEIAVTSGGISQDDIFDTTAKIAGPLGILGGAFAGIAIFPGLSKPIGLLAGAYAGFYVGILGGIILALPIAVMFGTPEPDAILTL